MIIRAVRIVAAFLFIAHGGAKILRLPFIEQFSPVELMSLGGPSGILELVGGFLLLIGLFTRATTFILSGEMAVAYFMAHAPKAFLPIINGGELAVLYCFVFLYISAAGPGTWSLDRWRGTRSDWAAYLAVDSLRRWGSTTAL